MNLVFIVIAFFLSINTVADFNFNNVSDLINNLIPVAFVFLVLLLAPLNETLDKLGNKNENPELQKYKDRFEVVEKAIKDISANLDPVFHNTYYFVETIIIEGEEKIKKEKEKDLLPKILTVIIIPLTLVYLSMQMGDPRTQYVLFSILILGIYIIVSVIDKTVSDTLAPLYSTYEWQRLLNILKLLLAKEKQIQKYDSESKNQ
jgi:hypothetical protein